MNSIAVENDAGLNVSIYDVNGNLINRLLDQYSCNCGNLKVTMKTIGINMTPTINCRNWKLFSHQIVTHLAIVQKWRHGLNGRSSIVRCHWKSSKKLKRLVALLTTSSPIAWIKNVMRTWWKYACLISFSTAK